MAEENIVSMAAASWKSDVSEVSLDLGLELEQEFIVVDELEVVESAEIQDGDHRVVEDHGIGEDLVNASSSRALSPMAEHANTVAATKHKSRLRTCWVCGVQTRGKIRRRVLKEHLPWCWYAAIACWECVNK
jgi:hypothetical protein